MASKNKSVYVDEDMLKRMVAGDTSALENMKGQEMQSEECIPLSEPSEKKEEKVVVIDKKPSASKKDSKADSFDEYRKRFLQMKLTGARRQTYIHDSLYKAFAKVLPVIAPEMSVPTFVNGVLSDHLDKYRGILNAMYNEEATKEAI